MSNIIRNTSIQASLLFICVISVANAYVTYADNNQFLQLHESTQKLKERVKLVAQSNTETASCTLFETSLYPEKCVEGELARSINAIKTSDIYRLGDKVMIMNYGLEDVLADAEGVTLFLSGVDFQTYQNMNTKLGDTPAKRLPDLAGQVKATQYENGQILMSLTYKE